MNVGMPARQISRLQWLIIAAHLVLAVLYGAVIPPWEAHDETGHYAFIDQLTTERALPVVRADSTVFLDQSHQPPLYYLVAGALTAWVDRRDHLQPAINLFAFDGSNRHGARIVLRTANEAFPWHGTVLALHAARIVSALLSGVMMCLIAQIATQLFPTSPGTAALATAIAAFNPQVLFMAAMVNNDVMVSLIGAAILLVAVRLIQQPDQSSAGRFVLLGILLGLALLSKRTSYGLVLFAALLLIGLAWRNRWTLGHMIGRTLAVVGPAVLISAPYFVRNLTLYGTLIADRKIDNPLFTRPAATLFGEGAAVALRDGWVSQIFINGFRTFWGTFGWGNVPLPGWAYFAFLAITVTGSIGFVAALWRADTPRRFVFIGLVTFFVSLLLPSLYQAVFFQNPQLFVGRYLMPALGAFACIVASGLAFWVHWRPALSNWLDRGLTAALAVFALVVPLAYLQPAYATRLVNLPPQPALLTFETSARQPVAQVLSADTAFVYLQDREGPRPYAHVRLVWRALQRTQANFVFGLSVLGYRNEVLGQTNQYPAGGNYPTTAWNAGDMFEDDYYILIDKPCAELPVQARINVAVFEQVSIADTSLPNPSTVMPMVRALKAVDAESRDTLPVVTPFRVEQSPPMFKIWVPPVAVMGNIWLRQVSLPTTTTAGSRLTVTLAYEPAQSNNPPAKVFVHLLGPDGQPVAQQDQVPHEGFYPTDQWVAGECVRETIVLDVPATASGTLRAMTGFYTADGTRFKTPDEDDNDLVELGSVQVQP